MTTQGDYHYLHLTDEARAAAERYYDAVRAFVGRRNEFVRSLTSEPSYMTGRRGRILAVQFKEPPGKGWRASPKFSGYWIPDRRTKAGRDMGVKFSEFTYPEPDELFALLENCGFESSNIQQLPTGSFLVFAKVLYVGAEFYLLVPHRKWNGVERPTSPLPPGMREVERWEFNKAECEAEAA